MLPTNKDLDAAANFISEKYRSTKCSVCGNSSWIYLKPRSGENESIVSVERVFGSSDIEASSYDIIIRFACVRCGQALMFHYGFIKQMMESVGGDESDG